MWVKFNNNPAGRNVGDCSVRATSVALDIDWETAYRLLADAGFNMCDMPSSNGVWGAILRQNGFYRETIPTSCPECYSADDFVNDNPSGIYVLGFGNHVATAIDGIIYDSFDSSGEIPQYFWHK